MSRAALLILNRRALRVSCLFVGVCFSQSAWLEISQAPLSTVLLLFCICICLRTTTASHGYSVIFWPHPPQCPYLCGVVRCFCVVVRGVEPTLVVTITCIFRPSASLEMAQTALLYLAHHHSRYCTITIIERCIFAFGLTLEIFCERRRAACLLCNASL